MLQGIKNWLIKWNLMPILWPFGPEGERGWIPAAIMAGSAIAGQMGGKKQQKEQHKLDQARLDMANRTADENFQRSEDFRDMVRDMFGAGGDYASLLTDPLTSTSSTNYFSNTTPTFTSDATNAIANMAQASMNERARADSLPEFVGVEEGWARDHANRMGELKTQLGNRAALRGAAPMDTGLEAILAGRGMTSDFLKQKGSLPFMKESARMQKNQIANMLDAQRAGLGRGQKTKGGSNTQTSQDQGAGAMLNYVNMLRPEDKTVYV
jgi:hypothetical protein